MLTVITIIVSKMTRHCPGTVQMREESESGIRKWEEMWFKLTAEDGERWRQQWRVMEDCSTDEQLQQETLCHRQWTDEYVERPETLMRQNVFDVWVSAGRSQIIQSEVSNMSVRTKCLFVVFSRSYCCMQYSWTRNMYYENRTSCMIFIIHISDPAILACSTKEKCKKIIIKSKKVQLAQLLRNSRSYGVDRLFLNNSWGYFTILYI